VHKNLFEIFGNRRRSMTIFSPSSALCARTKLFRGRYPEKEANGIFMIFQTICRIRQQVAPTPSNRQARRSSQVAQGHARLRLAKEAHEYRSRRDLFLRVPLPRPQVPYNYIPRRNCLLFRKEGILRSVIESHQAKE
jgi:hypothetical protein